MLCRTLALLSKKHAEWQHTQSITSDVGHNRVKDTRASSQMSWSSWNFNTSGEGLFGAQNLSPCDAGRRARAVTCGVGASAEVGARQPDQRGVHSMKVFQLNMPLPWGTENNRRNPTPKTKLHHVILVVHKLLPIIEQHTVIHAWEAGQWRSIWVINVFDRVPRVKLGVVTWYMICVTPAD